MYILDSNILIEHLNGSNQIKAWIAEKFADLFREITIWGDIVILSADLKRNSNLSLADAIILATAISQRIILVTNDKTLIKKAKDLVEVLSI